MQLKLRDIEVANDDFERQARNTTSSLEDLESKYNISIERGVMFEEEIRTGEQEREALRIENQRLRDELSDLKIEAEIRQDKLRHAEEAAATSQIRRKHTEINPDERQPQTPVSDHSDPTTTSSPTVATPPAKSASSTVSETLTPPSPPTSEHSAPALATPSIPLIKSRLSISDSNTTPRPQIPSRPPRYSRGLSTADKLTSSVPRRPTTNHQVNSQNGPGLPSSGSLHQIRGLIGKMQKLEQRVNSARSKLPAPTSTPPRASPRAGSALGQNSIPATITVRSNRKRTGGSNAAASLISTPDQRPQSRLSFGIPQPVARRDPNVNYSRPASRASISSRTSINHLPSATSATSSSRPASRQSMSGSRTPLGHYSTKPSQSESRRPRSSIGGSYASMHPGAGHAQPASASRLSNYRPEYLDEDEDEDDISNDALTPTPIRRTNLVKEETPASNIPAPATRKRYSGIGAGRRISSGLGEMGPPERRGNRKLSGVGETF